jgi:hypothetical protein
MTPDIKKIMWARFNNDQNSNVKRLIPSFRIDQLQNDVKFFDAA